MELDLIMPLGARFGLNVECSSNSFLLFLSESSQAGKTGGCFPGHSTVLTSTGLRLPLSKLQVGDKVLAREASTGSLVFSEVIMFLDYNPWQRREFLRFKLANGRTITLTPVHLLVLQDLTTAFASTVKVGDKLLVRGKDDEFIASVVVDVKLILDTGVYAPLTAEGTVVVDDVLASCYALVDSQEIAHWSFLPVRMAANVDRGFRRIWNLLSRPIAGWSAESPRRRPTAMGVHWYAKFLYTVGEYVIPGRLHK